MKRDFLKPGYNKIEKQLDKIIFLIVIISVVISFSIYFSSIPILYMYLDIIIALIFLFLSIFRDKVSLEIKFYVMIFVSIILGILVFFDGGFSSGFIILLTIGNIVPILLFNKKESLIINILSMILLIILGVWGTIYSKNLYINIGISKWITHVLLFLLFFMFFRIIFYNILDTLYNYLKVIENKNNEIFNLAYYDKLTNLPNNHLFIKEINKRAEKVSTAYVVMYYIKNLDFINSIYGIKVGDSVIIQLAKILQNQNLKLNVLAKTAGSELTFWVENISEETLLNYLNNIEEIIENKYKIKDLKHQIELIVSFTKYDANKMSPQESYNKAKIAMTYIKRKNTNKRIEYNDDLEQLIRYNAKLNNLIDKAIDNKEFTISYQTKICANNCKILGAEALARWESNELGKVSPGVFVPKIEEMDKTIQFGEIIIEKIFQEYNDLCKKYNQKMKVSINISPSHLMNSNFINYLKEKMKEHKIDGKNIIIEITEEVLIMGILEVNNILAEIRKLNISVSIDDFGTGYSSFSYLENLDVDEIKIDKSFIDKININKRSLIVIENIIALAKNLNLIVVAEGVEDKKQYESLLALKCDIIQGYYFSKPEAIN